MVEGRRESVEVARIVASACQRARQYYAKDLDGATILTNPSPHTPNFTLTFPDTGETFVVSVQREV